jgi:hypothetical protein
MGVPDHHAVQVYDGEESLCTVVASYIADGLAAGEAVLLIATAAHREAFLARVAERGINLDLAGYQGHVRWFDARETIERLLLNGTPDWRRFKRAIGEMLEQGRAAVNGGSVRVFGEMVDLLCQEGRSQAALCLEEYWNDLGPQVPVSLLCVYAAGHFRCSTRHWALDAVCRAHSAVILPAGVDLSRTLTTLQRDLEVALAESPPGTDDRLRERLESALARLGIWWVRSTA